MLYSVTRSLNGSSSKKRSMYNNLSNARLPESTIAIRKGNRICDILKDGLTLGSSDFLQKTTQIRNFIDSLKLLARSDSGWFSAKNYSLKYSHAA